MASTPLPVSPEKILVVDDVPANVALLVAALEPAGYEVLTVASAATALRLAAHARPDLILLDILLPDLSGLEACRALKADPATEDIPVIFITALQDVEHIVAGFQAGGADYIAKPFRNEEVLSRVATHLEARRLTHALQENNRALAARTAELTAEIERRRQAESALHEADQKLAVIADLEAGRGNLASLLGASPAMQEVLAAIQRLHPFPNTSVLITGESGTGKELVARAIHFGSARARAPFVPINCVAIPGELAESLLFGHVKGAFTGATVDRQGTFELAHGGTLFLDEIGDMPPTLQVKLLRVLEDGLITPIGASQARRVDVRIIAATNAHLEAQIERGTFRRDLYFRLARFTLTTPPLRQRLADIPQLAAHFLRHFAAEMGLKSPVITPAALEQLRHHTYPGNVRELRNLIESALIESGGGAIEPRHLRLGRGDTAIPEIAPAESGSTRATVAATGEVSAALPFNLAEAEEQLIRRALQHTGGNVADAARLLGVHRSRIYRRLGADEPAGG